MSRKSMVVAGVAAAALTGPMVASAAGAQSPQPRQAEQMRSLYQQRVVSKSYVAPLQFAVGKAIWVADAGTSTLTTVYKHKVWAHGYDPSKQGDLAGVALAPALNDVAYVESKGDHSVTKFVLLHNGRRTYSVDLAAYERRHNPDGHTVYGTPSSSKCFANVLKSNQIPVRYKGEKDSHPYSVVYLGRHQWAVADAGGNDVLRVDTLHNRVSTIAVLPPVRYIITKAFARMLHAPKCVIGKRYYSESVPSDVEVGPNGALYVSSLPGGFGLVPGGPGLGRVYTISPSGRMRMIGRGFHVAVNIAVSPHGSVYVAELGRDVALMKDGRPLPVIKLPGVVGVEWARGTVYASTAPAVEGGKGPGEIIRLAKR